MGAVIEFPVTQYVSVVKSKLDEIPGTDVKL